VCRAHHGGIDPEGPIKCGGPFGGFATEGDFYRYAWQKSKQITVQYTEHCVTVYTNAQRVWVGALKHSVCLPVLSMRNKGLAHPNSGPDSQFSLP